MAMKTIVQTSTTTTTATNKKTSSQLSSISLMLEYEIDNTLNTIKENNHLLTRMIRKDSICNDDDDDDDDDDQRIIEKDENLKKFEINNNNNDDHQEKSSSSSSVSVSTTARKRWKILAKVLRKDSSEDSIQDGGNSSSTSSSTTGGSYDDDNDDDDIKTASVRRFKSFDLLRQDSLDDTSEINILSKTENWYTYKICLNENIEYSVNIHHIERHLTANDLMGFNNTGNICVWPSEEALTVYILSNLQNFRNKWILELGGGMTCLAGLMLAKYSKAYVVNLTDGNEISIENVQRTLCLNKLSCYTKCSVLKWEDYKTRLNTDYERFDWILSADCLFFDDARLSLIDTIWYYLSLNGIALIMAPKRGKTLEIFVNECIKKGFQYQIIHNYNDIIWKRHLQLISTSKNLYDENIHYPILIKLYKCKNKSSNITTTTTTFNATDTTK